MNVPSAPVFRPEDLPDVAPEILALLNSSFRELYDTIRSIPARGIATGSFISNPSGVSTLAVKSPISQKPSHVTLTMRRDDFADFAAAWSWWYRVDGELLRLSFIGLPASTRLVYTLEAA